MPKNGKPEFFTIQQIEAFRDAYRDDEPKRNERRCDGGESVNQLAIGNCDQESRNSFTEISVKQNINSAKHCEKTIQSWNGRNGVIVVLTCIS